MASTLGDRIQLMLTAKGMTRKELSEKTGLTEAAISRYITNKREPKSITLSSIANALDTSLDELLGTPCNNSDELSNAIQLVARSANEIPTQKRKQLIDALIGY